MSALVDQKLREWTVGLDRENATISIFRHIRDIPYSLAIPMIDPRTAPEQILALGRGYCGPKHYLLGEMYRRLGYEVVYATLPFVWNDPDLQYPRELRQLATGLPMSHHLACRVRINGSWVLVDATWDLPLKRGGFPVNEHWDGRADTLCAVKPLRSAVRTAFCHSATNEPRRDSNERDLNPCNGGQDLGDADDHARYYREKTGVRTEDDIERIRRFNHEFDKWLQEIRVHR
jgi:hypothetical protein